MLPPGRAALPLGIPHRLLHLSNRSHSFVFLSFLFLDTKFPLSISLGEGTAHLYSIRKSTFNSTGTFYFSHGSCHEFTDWVPAAPAPFRCFSQGVLLLAKRLALLLNPDAFLFGSLLVSIIFLHNNQEAVLALRVLNMLNTYIHSLGKKRITFSLLVCNAKCMLGNTVDSSSFAMVTFVGIPVWTGPVPLMSPISPFLYTHVYVAKGLGNTWRVPLLFPLCLSLVNYWEMAAVANKGRPHSEYGFHFRKVNYSFSWI